MSGEPNLRRHTGCARIFSSDRKRNGPTRRVYATYGQFCFFPTRGQRQIPRIVRQLTNQQLPPATEQGGEFHARFRSLRLQNLDAPHFQSLRKSCPVPPPPEKKSGKKIPWQFCSEHLSTSHSWFSFPTQVQFSLISGRGVEFPVHLFWQIIPFGSFAHYPPPPQ